MTDDSEMLRRYVEAGSEEAFAELVRRHVGLVYSAALRQVNGDPHLAQDVTQVVFADLARKAASLSRRPALTGWLYTSTHFAAAKAVRKERRRRTREQEASTMRELLHDSAPELDWRRLRPLLDAEMHKLGERDRESILLRYFENRSLADIGSRLGLSEDAARKLVHRALEKLRARLAKHGITTTTALATVLSANAMQVAPAGLATTVSSAALANAAAAATTVTSLNFMAMTHLKTAILGGIVLAAAVTPLAVLQHRAAVKSRADNQRLRQQIAVLTSLQAENLRLSNQVSELRQQAQNSASPAPSRRDEVLRLRGEVTSLQQQLRDQEQRPPQIPGALTNALTAGVLTATQWRTRQALARLARMKQMLHLTPEQEQMIREMMTNRIQRTSQLTLAAMMGRLTPEQAAEGVQQSNEEEADIKELLTPDQLAAYPEFKKKEAATAARNAAASETKSMTDTLRLTSDQQAKVYASLYDLHLQEHSGPASQPVPPPLNSSDVGALIQSHVERQKRALEQKEQALAGILSPDQLKTYEQQQLAQINRMAKFTQMLLPASKPASAD